MSPADRLVAHPDPPAPAGGRLAAHLMPAALALLGLATALALVAPLSRIDLPLELPNEGWNATHALHAFDGGLYPAPGGFIANNYPPLWFYLTGLLGALFGDPIFPGRILALAGFAGTALALFALVRRLGGSRAAGSVAALSFAVIVAGLFDGWVGLAEPQLPAHGLVTLGAAILVGARSRKAVAAAALVMLAGGLVKHVAIALPLASAVWLLLYRRELARAWFAAGLVAALAALLALVAGYGGAFLDNVGFPRLLSLDRLATNLAHASRVAVPLIAYLAVAYVERRRFDPAMAYAGLAIVAGFVSILAFGGASGVSSNIAFDLVIAASIGFGLVWDRIGIAYDARKAGLLRLLLVAALLVRVGAGLSADQIAVGAERQRLVGLAATLVALRDRLATVEAPAACEALSVCVWAGRPSAVDLWKLRHERTLASLDTARLLAAIARGEFGAVVTLGNISGPQQDGNLPGLWAALAQGYAPPVHYGTVATLFLPRGPAAE